MKPKFEKTPDKDGLVFRHSAHITPKYSLQIGLYPTLYGMRVRAGWEGKLYYHLDWCCGAEDATINLAYKLCLAVLNARLDGEPSEIFSGIPICSKIKPLPLDLEFMDYVSQLPQKPVKIEPLPRFHELREQHARLMENEWPNP